MMRKKKIVSTEAKTKERHSCCLSLKIKQMVPRVILHYMLLTFLKCVSAPSPKNNKNKGVQNTECMS